MASYGKQLIEEAYLSVVLEGVANIASDLFDRGEGYQLRDVRRTVFWWVNNRTFLGWRWKRDKCYTKNSESFTKWLRRKGVSEMFFASPLLEFKVFRLQQVEFECPHHSTYIHRKTKKYSQVSATSQHFGAKIRKQRQRWLSVPITSVEQWNRIFMFRQRASHALV